MVYNVPKPSVSHYSHLVKLSAVHLGRKINEKIKLFNLLLIFKKLVRRVPQGSLLGAPLYQHNTAVLSLHIMGLNLLGPAALCGFKHTSSLSMPPANMLISGIVGWKLGWNGRLAPAS